MLGIALEAGGIKGAAHIGVLQALEEEGIKVDYISGSSSGSIVASMYAIGYSPIQILAMYKSYCKTITDYDRKIPFKLMSLAFTGRLKLKGLAKGRNLENALYEMCKRKGVFDIADVKFPLAVPAVDIYTGETIYYINRPLRYSSSFDTSFGAKFKRNGFLPEIVRASSSIPAVFEPKYINGNVLVDGGVKVGCPIKILKDMGADKVIAVSFTSNKSSRINENCNMIDITLSSFDIMTEEIKKFELKNADFTLNIDATGVMTLDCSKINYMANLGYQTTKKYIEEIKKIVN
ncbi:MAG: patatin-like phospholipase family protein [Clostridia bacterium]|nr:patatin-like phospholipase family protein [Clostridia bacterium]